MIRLYHILTIILFTGLLATSCKDEVAGPEGSPSDIVFPAANVRYGEHVQAMFNQTCALGGCHDDGQNQSPLKLTSYGNTVFGVLGVVVQGSPDQSTLVLRIEGRLGQRMPLNRNALNQNQINGIRTWIAEGAQNN